MEKLDLIQDYKHFREIWEYKNSNSMKHTAKVWDGRAEDWEKELKQSPSFCKSLEERVTKAAQFLREHSLLGEKSEVIDIGCGAGRFAVEFARTAGHVTGIDLSSKMLELGETYAKKCGRENISFLQGDFGDFDVKALGWEKKFDLVFTSITPAIGTMKNLEKIMQISRGFCFNSCFIRWEDELETQIAREVFHMEQAYTTKNQGHSFYALFNLLWLQGYFPETQYHRQTQDEYVKAGEDLARYYAKCFSKNMLADETMIHQIHVYLKQHANEDGMIQRKYERWYGWILWDVRNREKRLPEEMECVLKKIE